MRRTPLVISPVKRDVMRHMLLAGLRPHEIKTTLDLRSSDQVRFRPRRKAPAETGVRT